MSKAAGPATFFSLIAALIVIPTWFFYIAYHVRSWRRQRREVIHVPDELAEPPSSDDAAVVATVIGEGTPSRRAVAATVLELAARSVLSLQEYGERMVVEIPDTATGATETENLVIEGLRANAGPNGDVEGPPVWPRDVGWWRQFRRDARERASAAGLVAPRIPYIGLILVFVFTSVGFSLVYFERISVFVGTILFANGVPHLLARASGYKLTTAGRQSRAAWLAFGRYLREHSNLRDAGAAAVAVWGPNLVAAVLLGEAPRAAAALTPGAVDTDEDEAAAGPISVEL
jgi:uncharacterized membrane protein